MKKETKALLTKYAICFGVAALIAFIVFFVEGFFTNDAAHNIQVLSDGFIVSGIILTFATALIYISDTGALVGVGFTMRNAFLTFVPMGRAKMETFAKYRERVLSKKKQNNVLHILIVGVSFLFLGIVFSIIWTCLFLNKAA